MGRSIKDSKWALCSESESYKFEQRDAVAVSVRNPRENNKKGGNGQAENKYRDEGNQTFAK